MADVLLKVNRRMGRRVCKYEVRSPKSEVRKLRHAVERFLSSGGRMTTDLPEDLSERSFQFACDIYDYCEDLVPLRGLPCRVAYQLFDAAGSVGANRAEAKSSYTDRDFASKNAIVLRECREARFWRRLADVKSLENRERRRRLLREAHELVSIFAEIVRQLKAKLRVAKGNHVS
jgi:four helix bundle protein